MLYIEKKIRLRRAFWLILDTIFCHFFVCSGHFSIVTFCQFLSTAVMLKSNFGRTYKSREYLVHLRAEKKLSIP